MKTINCKHGLNNSQELQARELRKNILEGDYECIKERVLSLYAEYKKKILGSFYEYIKEKDIVLYSAFERAGGIKNLYDCLEQFELI